MMPQHGLKLLRGWIFLALLLLTAGCLPDLGQQEIYDLERMPQQPLAYLDPATSDQPLVAPERQEEMAADFLERYFLAWYTDEPLESTRRPFWAVDWIGKNKVFAENLRPATHERLRELVERADPQSYPSLDRRAVTVRRCDLRALPTRRPLFNDPREAGEGFPFDILQHAALQADTPVHVTHRSRDGAWVFVETSLVYGWMPVTDLAWVDDDFVRTFETGCYLALTQDNVVVSDDGGIYRFSAGIGTLLPVVDTGSEGYRVLLAVADKDQQALLAKATIPFDRGELFPLPLTPRRIANLAGRMVGEPYGWGESFGDRDCSATIRDLFAPFGLWLPRNSSAQARAGSVIPLSDLTPSKREERLLAEGVPFLTLVRIPGHIMLYIGERAGRAVVLQTLWGLRTRSLLGREGRWIVGRTMITTLEPGSEMDGLFRGIGSLRDRVKSMNILTPSSSPREAATLEAKIGQMLMVGFRGTAVDENHFIIRDIRRYNLGGVILFDYDVLKGEGGRNIESPSQVQALVASLQAASSTPLLIAVDQEGGRVARLKERYGFPPTLSHGELGRIDDPEYTARQSGRLAETLAVLGIGLNLAPVVDLCANPDNPVIAGLDRCFSADPQKVARHALEFIEAHHRNGVLTTLKHFPGHGSSRSDSHLGFTDVTDTWSRAELEPYARIIAGGQADAVMIAHVFNARLDPAYPATLSRNTITGLLRGELGFDGVVISDDMQMRAIVDNYDLETAIRKAIEAGVDILLFGNNMEYGEEIVPKAVAIIRNMVRTGAVSEARIDESYRRIMRLKSRLMNSPTPSQRR